MKNYIHWFKALLLLEAGIVIAGLLLAEPASPHLARPAWGWWLGLSLLVGFMPLYLRRRHRFQLRALLLAIAAGVACALLTRYWQAEMASFSWFLMLVGLIVFKTEQLG